MGGNCGWDGRTDGCAGGAAADHCLCIGCGRCMVASMVAVAKFKKFKLLKGAAVLCNHIGGPGMNAAGAPSYRNFRSRGGHPRLQYPALACVGSAAEEVGFAGRGAPPGRDGGNCCVDHWTAMVARESQYLLSRALLSQTAGRREIFARARGSRVCIAAGVTFERTVDTVSREHPHWGASQKMDE